mmetsp:Transcript_9561/g.14664  ORF Transcript_9561/g.14664 Transcript_9561/m.14664 type:complete len:1657 (+) Transcript_9561:62-5032(+)
MTSRRTLVRKASQQIPPPVMLPEQSSHVSKMSSSEETSSIWLMVRKHGLLGFGPSHWKRRFAKLEGDLMLLYADDGPGAEFKGTVQIRGVLVGIGKSKHKGKGAFYCFTLTESGSSTITWAAFSRQERSRWVRALKQRGASLDQAAETECISDDESSGPARTISSGTKLGSLSQSNDKTNNILLTSTSTASSGKGQFSQYLIPDAETTPRYESGDDLLAGEETPSTPGDRRRNDFFAQSFPLSFYTEERSPGQHWNGRPPRRASAAAEIDAWQPAKAIPAMSVVKLLSENNFEESQVFVSVLETEKKSSVVDIEGLPVDAEVESQPEQISGSRPQQSVTPSKRSEQSAKTVRFDEDNSLSYGELKEGFSSPPQNQNIHNTLKSSPSGTTRNSNQAGKHVVPGWLAKETHLGSGSFGKVYRGTYFNQRVAIKELFVQDLSSESIAEFEREADLHYYLRHNNIILLLCYNVDLNNGPTCMVMELAECSLFDILHRGVPLPELRRAAELHLKKGGTGTSGAASILANGIGSINSSSFNEHDTNLAGENVGSTNSANTAHTNSTATLTLGSENTHLNLERKLRMLEDVASGLVFLHTLDIMHLDLKSLNLLLDANGVVKLADFGLSVVKSEIEGSQGKAIGSLPYIAPELMVDDPVPDKMCDIYSFYVVIWEVVCQQQPHYERSPAWIMRFVSRKKKKLEIPKHVGCPERLEALMLRCAEFEPRNRPTMEACQRAIADIRADPVAPSLTRVELPKNALFTCEVTHNKELSVLKAPRAKLDDDLAQFGAHSRYRRQSSRYHKRRAFSLDDAGPLISSALSSSPPSRSPPETSAEATLAAETAAISQLKPNTPPPSDTPPKHTCLKPYERFYVEAHVAAANAREDGEDQVYLKLANEEAYVAAFSGDGEPLVQLVDSSIGAERLALEARNRGIGAVIESLLFNLATRHAEAVLRLLATIFEILASSELAAAAAAAHQYSAYASASLQLNPNFDGTSHDESALPTALYSSLDTTNTTTGKASSAETPVIALSDVMRVKACRRVVASLVTFADDAHVQLAGVSAVVNLALDNVGRAALARFGACTAVIDALNRHGYQGERPYEIRRVCVEAILNLLSDDANAPALKEADATKALLIVVKDLAMPVSDGRNTCTTRDSVRPSNTTSRASDNTMAALVALSRSQTRPLIPGFAEFGEEDDSPQPAWRERRVATRAWTSLARLVASEPRNERDLDLEALFHQHEATYNVVKCAKEAGRILRICNARELGEDGLGDGLLPSPDVRNTVSSFGGATTSSNHNDDIDDGRGAATLLAACCHVIQSLAALAAAGRSGAESPKEDEIDSSSSAPSLSQELLDAGAAEVIVMALRCACDTIRAAQRTGSQMGVVEADDLARRASAGTMALAASSNRARELLGEAGICETSVDVIRYMCGPANPDLPREELARLRYYAVGALSNLAFWAPSNKERLEASGALRAISYCAEAGADDLELQRLCCRAFCTLGTLTKAEHNGNVDDSSANTYADASSDDDSDDSFDIAVHANTANQYHLKARHLSVITQAMLSFDDALLQYLACAAIINLAANPRHRRALGRVDACEAVTAALKAHPIDAQVQEYGFRAAVYLSRDDPENRDRFYAHGVRRLAAAAAKLFSANPQVLQWAQRLQREL